MKYGGLPPLLTRPGKVLIEAGVDAATLRLVRHWITGRQNIDILPDDDRLTSFAIELEKAAARIERVQRRNNVMLDALDCEEDP